MNHEREVSSLLDTLSVWRDRAVITALSMPGEWFDQYRPSWLTDAEIGAYWDRQRGGLVDIERST